MYPDFIEDGMSSGLLNSSGVTELFNAPEAFVAAWETCLKQAPNATPPQPSVLITSCQPNQLKLGVPQRFMVTAKDSKSSKTVQGNVLVNGTRIGLTGVELTDTFRVQVAGSGNRPANKPAPIVVEPAVVVEAPGYALSPVSIHFTESV